MLSTPLEWLRLVGREKEKPGSQHQGSLSPKLLPTIPWLSGSRVGPGPIYQLQSQALKLETSQTDKGELGGRGALWAPDQVCSDYLEGLIKLPCP